MTSRKEMSGVYKNEFGSTSTTQLTDPPLYSIYGGRNIIDDENEDVKDVNQVNGHVPYEPNDDEPCTGTVYSDGGSIVFSFLRPMFFGITVYKLFQTLHYNDPVIFPSLNLPIDYGSNHGFFNEAFMISLNTIVLDRFLGILITFFWGKSNVAIRERSISQLFVVILGIVYFFRKIAWTSTVHADLIFMLINVIFTRYVGCTLGETVVSLLMFGSSMGVLTLLDNVNGGSQTASNLWRCTFLWFLSVVLLRVRETEIGLWV